MTPKFISAPTIKIWYPMRLRSQPMNLRRFRGLPYAGFIFWASATVRKIYNLYGQNVPILVSIRSNIKLLNSSRQRKLPMKRVAVLIVVVSVGLSLMFVRGTVIAGQDGWPPPNPGCHYTGNSACGGDDHGQCAPQERFMSQQCRQRPG